MISIRSERQWTLTLACVLGLAGGCAPEATGSSGAALLRDTPRTRNAYVVHRLVSDNTSLIPAENQDTLLLNPWGLAAGPTTYWWVADNGSSRSTLYDGEGNKQNLVVTVPGDPSGLVYYGGDHFMVTQGMASGPARFIFASEDGTISAWSAGVPPPPLSHNAFVVVPDAGNGAVYKGLAFSHTASGDRLFATDFHNGRVDVFSDDWKLVSMPNGAFVDADIPPGFAPFGIRAFDHTLIVTYALQDSDAHDDVAGPGHGFVDAYDESGMLLFRVASRAQLNSPWGLAMAPDDFGRFSGDLLVGNFGNGRIHAFDLSHCERRGCLEQGELHNDHGGAIVIDGLWALDFGKGNDRTGDEDELYFTAGPNDEADGLFGYIEPAEIEHHRR